MSVLVRNLIGLMAKNATIGGQGVTEAILDHMALIPAEAITPDIEEVWVAMRTLAEQGERPTLLSLRRLVPGRDDGYWQSFAPKHPDIGYLQREIVREVEASRMTAALSASLKALEQPDANLDSIRSVLTDMLEKPLAGSVEARHVSEVDPMAQLADISAGKVKIIKTPWPYLNRALGGGLHVGGENAMTAVLAFTGVGKSGFAKQLAEYVTRKEGGGHHLLYLSGESTNAVIIRDLMRLRAFIPKDRLHSPTPDVMQKMADAKKQLDAADIFVHDRDFSLDVLRALMTQRAHKMRQSKEEGKTPQNACLLVVVDNLDHVIPSGQKDEWQAIESVARSLYKTALRLGDVHVVVLCQATERSFLLGRAPGLNDFARARLIASHCSNVIGLYRPTSIGMTLNMKGEEMPNMVQPKIGLPKTREGSGNEFSVHTDAEMGRWE